MVDSKRKKGWTLRERLYKFYSVNYKFYSVNKSIILISFQLLVIVFLFDTLGGGGLLLFVLFWVGMGLFKAWVGRQYIMNFIKSIESLLFGKPLDKGLWKQGELRALKKKRKLKFVWKKNEK